MTNKTRQKKAGRGGNFMILYDQQAAGEKAAVNPEIPVTVTVK